MSCNEVWCLPSVAAVATLQPLASRTIVPMALPTVTRPRDSHENVISGEDGPNVRHAGVAAALEINTAERDLEAGSSILSPAEPDCDGDKT